MNETTCLRCEGHGEITDYDLQNAGRRISKVCPDCDGDGLIAETEDDDPCTSNQEARNG